MSKARDSALLRWMIRTALRLCFKVPSLLPLPVSWLRQGMEASAVLFPVDPRVAISVDTLGGVLTDTLQPAVHAGFHIVHLHGGAFFTGSRRTHRALAAQLSLRSGACVHLPDYRLAPEHPWPAAPNDALAVWMALRARGIPAERIVLSGDSAGCALAIGLAQALRDKGEAGPAALLLMSPYLDLSLCAASVRRLRWRDPMVTERALRRGGDAYRASIPATDARVSPLFGELHGLPPALVQVGSDEILLDDARRYATLARHAGSQVLLQETAGAWHDFQLFCAALPSAGRAMDELAAWAAHHALPPDTHSLMDKAAIKAAQAFA